MSEQPEELVIVFKTPIKNQASDEITQIVLKEPTAGQWKRWDKLSGVEADIKAVSVVSRHPEFVIEQMVSSQLIEGATYLAGFMRAGPSTGANG